MIMKYFEIQDSPELKCAPQLKDWYGKFDVRDIRLDRYPKLPDMQLFIVEPSENLVFTDIVLFPFLLVSPTVKKVIEMYRERCFFRNIILLDQKRKESKLYHLPVLDETSEIQLRNIRYQNGTCIPDEKKIQGQPIELNRNLFWVCDSVKRHTVLSLDMAESLIRRGITGLGLCETKLYAKNKEGTNQ